MAIGSGGILTSARDMAKYMQFHLNQGKMGSEQIVPQEAMKWMYRASNSDVAGEFKTENASSTILDLNYAYGLGLGLGVYDAYAPFVYSEVRLVVAHRAKAGWRVKKPQCGLDEKSENFIFLTFRPVLTVTRWQTISHGGFLPPYESMMTLVPGLKLGIFTAMNGPRATYETEYNQHRLHAKIFDAVQAAELFGNGRIKILSTTKSDQGDPERCHLPQKE
ncbi:hypothetical protein Fcan01_26787 [Folsomia candida]|uniref:Beta-lactamase-related domain-containing protein n=1 Tax=Folsomia candida TaxID=158441 RepID=A0A226D055_FOLCA|nr:hypothetical protein Fcan01_26787 [Folsomia candida]